MNEDLKIGQFDRVRVEVEGPDVRLTMPKIPSQAHWTDFQQIVNALQLAIHTCQQWEASKRNGDG